MKGEVRLRESRQDWRRIMKSRDVGEKGEGSGRNEDSAEPVVTVLCHSLLPCGWELYGMRGREGKGRVARGERRTMHTRQVGFT
ncbi:hypothetical protein E2C01_101620 [Portunus trituberculatus]|uniref:Uncharacterized protein n=1 Tax=Portunus trituberculatus TaxID=210409 RepID=A0A5B7KFB8_PORTR|nr:hypothetical protein [Portunus trituberculatus]